MKDIGDFISDLFAAILLWLHGILTFDQMFKLVCTPWLLLLIIPAFIIGFRLYVAYERYRSAVETTQNIHNTILSSTMPILRILLLIMAVLVLVMSAFFLWLYTGI